MSNFKQIIEESFKTYAAVVIQQRALIDVADALKPSARMCFYAQKLAKIDFNHTIQPSPNSVGEAIKNFYVNGDSSCYSLLMRYGKDFASRYPLIEVDGSVGSLESSNNEPASRYTKMRLNKLGTSMFEGIDEDAIDVWYDNYSETKKYPSVLPSLGYYNIVNGTTGIAIGLSASIPQTNLREVNQALIKLLWNPEIDFEEIYCPPDFATGGILINENEVKESMKEGRGKSCKIRAAIEFDEKERCLVVTEVPYGVYTSTICRELSNYIEAQPNCGIERFLDLTGKTALIKIYLTKTANVQRVIKNLYKNTSLQSYFGINMTMLSEGVKPKVFGWKEALLAHLEHEKKVLTNIYNYRLEKIKGRIHIIDGILIALANIEEVVKIIRGEKDKSSAKNKLIERFNFSNDQVEAILKITLSKLANLEIQSFKDEKQNLILQKESFEDILNNEVLLKKEIEKNLIKVMNEYGDERRTKCINLDFTSDDEDAEPIEQKELLIYYTNFNNIYTQESSTLLVTRRGTKGKKLKMEKNEIITKTLVESNFSSLMAFTNTGKMYSCNTDILPINSKINATELFSLEMGERITTLTTLSKEQEIDYFVFTTKKGMIKKTLSSEYTNKRGKGIKCIRLKEEDEVLNVHFIKDEPVGILTSSGNFVLIETTSINPIGRVTMGVKSVKLSEDETVLSSHAICKKDKTLITLSKKGFIKKTSLSEYPICGRATKGHQIAGVYENDSIIKFLTLSEDCDIIIVTEKGNIKINSSTLNELGRNAKGVKALTLKDDVNAVDILRE